MSKAALVLVTLVATLALEGCIMFPAPGRRTDAGVAPRQVWPNITTRAKLIEKAGDPDLRTPDGRFFLYQNIGSREWGLCVFGVSNSSSPGSCTRVGTHRWARWEFIEFDENGVVTKEIVKDCENKVCGSAQAALLAVLKERYSPALAAEYERAFEQAKSAPAVAADEPIATQFGPFSPGDTFVYNSGVPFLRLHERYLREEDGHLVFERSFSGQKGEFVYTRDGNPVRWTTFHGVETGPVITASPDTGRLKFPMKVGMSWTHSYRLASGPRAVAVAKTASMKVRAYEQVRTAAGEFSAFRIERLNQYDFKATSDVEVYWFAPKVGRIVKYRSQSQTVELKRYTRGVATAPTERAPVESGRAASEATAAPAPPPTIIAKAAPAIQQGAVSTAYKIGIFSASGCFASDGSTGCGWIGEKETAQTLAAGVRSDPAFALVYSHYEEALSIPRMRKPDRLWTDDGADKRPNLEAVYAEAKARRLDGVLMYRGDGNLSGGSVLIRRDVPIELYAIDVSSRQVRVYKGMTSTAKTVAAQALSTFLAGAEPKVAPTSLPAETATAGPAIRKGAGSTPYKVAIFPFDTDDGCIGRSGRPADEKFAAELAVLIASNDSLTLAYSYYDDNLNTPPIRKPGRLWVGSKPSLAQVSTLGEAQGLDAIVMYWRADSAPGWPYCTNRQPPFPIDVYVIDVKQRKTYRLEGTEEDLSALTERALSRFLADTKPK